MAVAEFPGSSSNGRKRLSSHVAVNLACEMGKRHFAGSVTTNAKGALGQSLVQKYFEYAGWAVSPTGIESVVDHLMHHRGLDRGDLGKLPDLVVSKVAGLRTNPKSHPLGQAFYVEVKTWARWPDGERDLSRYSKFGTVLVVWVSPEGLQGTWLSKPPGDNTKPVVAGDARKVLASDFTKLAFVGSVALQHCRETSCERRLREEFDAVAKALAALPF